MSRLPNRDYEPPGLKEAKRALKLRGGPPGPEDVPPPSLFPMTPVAKEALRIYRKQHGVPGSRS